MRVFVTGATGYIGGTVALALRDAGHDVSGLARSDDGADLLAKAGIAPVRGALDETEALARAAGEADAVAHAADADHAASARALLAALGGTGKTLIHTSGSSIVGTPAGGRLLAQVYDEDTPFTPSSGRAARVALNAEILAGAGQGLRPVIVCPALIYGKGRLGGRQSMQVPWLIATARRHGIAKHLGPGENRWSNVHVDDLADLYLLALDRAPPGAFYYAENGENSMRELCVAIGRTLGFGDETAAMSEAEAAAEWGEGPALNTMGSNSRVRAVRARAELGWAPHRPSVADEIARAATPERERRPDEPGTGAR